VLGACGAWPEAGRACSAFLVEHDGFRLLLDAGYAALPRLLEHVAARDIDAVFISHGHPDHCADLNPLLRARALDASPPPPLPVYALPGALDAVLALDRPGMLDDAYELRSFEGGAELSIGPFAARTALLPHWLPNAGVRLTAGGRALAYTGDSAPSPAMVALARRAEVFLAEATYAGPVPGDSRGHMSSAADAAAQAAAAGARRLLLTHLWPGTDPAAALAAAVAHYDGDIAVAVPGLTADL